MRLSGGFLQYKPTRSCPQSLGKAAEWSGIRGPYKVKAAHVRNSSLGLWESQLDWLGGLRVLNEAIVLNTILQGGQMTHFPVISRVHVH